MKLHNVIGSIALALLVACGGGSSDSLEGTWVFDMTRLEQLDIVATASSDSERNEAIERTKAQVGEYELVITKDQMKLSTGAGAPKETPYTLLKRDGNKLTLEVERIKGKKDKSVVELDGNKLTMFNDSGQVMFVFKRK